MFLEHNSNIVLEILDIIMLCKHNVPEAYFILRQIVQARVIKESLNTHGKSARDTGEFLKSVAHFLQMLYMCYICVIYNI